MKIYLNGALKGTLGVTGTMAATTNNIRIGNNPSSNRQFSGTIDEVKLYNYSQTQQEILSDYAVH